MIAAVVDDHPIQDLEDEALAARADREVDAFTELYDRYSLRVYRFVRSQTPDDSVAEDLTAETFFKALSGARGFRGHGSYQSWIFRIARNTISTWRAKHKKAPVVVEEVPEKTDPAPTPAAALLTTEQNRIVRDLVATLPPAQREVVSLRYLEDLSHGEIAHVTGRTRGAVRILLHRARASLRGRLGEGGLA